MPIVSIARAISAPASRPRWAPTNRTRSVSTTPPATSGSGCTIAITRNYQGAPDDGSVWEGGNCDVRIVRGGAYRSPGDFDASREAREPSKAARGNTTSASVSRATCRSTRAVHLSQLASAIDWERIDTVLLDMDGTLLDLHYDNHLLAGTPTQLRYAELKGLGTAGAARQYIAGRDRAESRAA